MPGVSMYRYVRIVLLRTAIYVSTYVPTYLPNTPTRTRGRARTTVHRSTT